MQMRRLFLLAALLSITLLTIVGSVAARPAQATTISTTCSYEKGTEWFSGDMYHVRGQINTAVEQSDNPMLNGVGTIVLNFDLNLVDGSGRTWGTWVNETDNFDATWVGRYHGKFEQFQLSIKSVARGTGELRGKTRIGQYTGIVDPPDPAPCDNPLEAETWQVKITGP